MNRKWCLVASWRELESLFPLYLSFPPVSTTPTPLLSGFPIQRQLWRIWVWERVCLGRNVAGGWGRHEKKLLKGKAIFPCCVTMMNHPAAPPLLMMEGIIAHMLGGHVFLEMSASEPSVGWVEASVELQGRTPLPLPNTAPFLLQVFILWLLPGKLSLCSSPLES